MNVIVVSVIAINELFSQLKSDGTEKVFDLSSKQTNFLTISNVGRQFNVIDFVLLSRDNKESIKCYFFILYVCMCVFAPTFEF